MARPNLDQRDYKIIQLWNEHKNVEKVSFLIGMSRGGIYRILDKHQIIRPHPGGRAKGFIPDRRFNGLPGKTIPIKWDRPLTCLNNKGTDNLLERLWAVHATDEMIETRGAC